MDGQNVLTAVITGLLVGYLGVLLALKQFKAQRAFDRQLEWYERTLRALGGCSRLQRQMVLVPMFENPDRTLKAWEELQKGLAELEQCTNEAVLYADQNSYEQLCRMGEKYEELKTRISTESSTCESDSTEGGRTSEVIAALNAAEKAETERVNRVLRETFVELSKPTRKMLGLRAIKLWSVEK